MNKKNISPHVQIYKFPIAALSSITTRLTGLYLSGVFIAYGVAKIQKHDALIRDTYQKSNKHLQTMFHYSLLFPTIYHTMGGMRHFVWDRFPSSLLTNSNVARSSYLLFAASSASTFLAEKYIKMERK
jgi:succinate dehydrogenase (ubiquinone) cytochrome b560 subunit